MQNRAVGIIRVSEQGDRDPENFMSPEDQRGKLERYCEADGLRLLKVYEEIDVSGGKPLEQRTKGLLPAVRAVEADEADIILVAYFDRLVRSLNVQGEVIERVERSGGDIYTLDMGKVTNGNAATRLTSNMMGSVFEFIREQGREKSWEGIMLAIDKGHWPVKLIPGLKQLDNGAVELDPDNWEAVREGFEMRARGATVTEVRAHLARHGIKRSYAGTYTMLKSRQAIGELHYDGRKIADVPALVEKPTFKRIEEKIELRGRQAKSERLLARLGVLRCGTCGARMVAGTQTQRGQKYPFYRCQAMDCTRRMTIGADLVEAEVIAETQRLTMEAEGRASADLGLDESAAELERAQKGLDRAIEAFEASGLDTEPAAITKLGKLREVRDAAKARHEERLDSLDAHDVVIRTMHYWDVLKRTTHWWDDLTREEQRDLIKATIVEVRIVPGRGKERIKIEPRLVRKRTAAAQG